MELWEMSLAGSLMILAVMLVRALALDRLPKATFPVLWGAVLCRLLLPFSVAAPFSATDLVLKQTPAPLLWEGPSPSLPSAGAAPGLAASAGIPIWPIVWAAGATALAGYFLLTHLRFRSRCRTAVPIPDPYRLDGAATDWTARRLKRPVRVLCSDRIDAPLTYGLWRPVVLLPKSLDWTDESRLRYVLAHEFAHIRRCDTLWKWLLAAALCAHWFNPLVWRMYSLAGRDLELACDAAVLRGLGTARPAAYALTLLSLEETRGSRPMPLSSGFSRNATEERIRSIMRYKKRTVPALLAAAVVVAVVVAVFVPSAPPETAPGATTGQSDGSSAAGPAQHARDDGAPSPQGFDAALYAPFGVDYDAATGKLTYQDKSVRVFEDQRSAQQQFLWSFDDNGVVDLYAVRDDGAPDASGVGELIGVEAYGPEAFDARTDALARRQSGAADWVAADALLRALWTEDYASMTVADFNRRLLDQCGGAGPFFEWMSLSAEQLTQDDPMYAFFRTTLAYSSSELYAAQIGGQETPYVSGYAVRIEPDGETLSPDLLASVNYVLTYRIEDPTLTVGERDQAFSVCQRQLQQALEALRLEELSGEALRVTLPDALRAIAEQQSDSRLSLRYNGMNYEAFVSGSAETNWSDDLVG